MGPDRGEGVKSGSARITDVASRARVSPATVSRVLNGSGEVSPELARRVRQAVEELSYQPFGPARALRRQTTSVWAVIVADIENPFFTSVVRGIEDGARQRGYRVVLCNSDEDLAKESEYIDITIAERVSGVVIAVASTRQSNLQPLIDRSIPIVAIDRRPVGYVVDTVLADNRLAARQATEHLIEAGFTSIGCITGPRRLSTANDRLAGYRDALVSAGRPVIDEYVLREDFREGGGYEAVTALWSKKRRPDALVVANNQMTVGALHALLDLGVKVPAEVGIVGFDDSPWASLVRPQLSVVAQPTYEIGQTAAELLSTATHAGGPRHVLLSPKLVIRESSLRP